jgi:butyryl-CoA dehydrogenase
VFGLVSVPSQGTYNSAKFAVRGFTDALRIELDMAKCGVSATTIHPGGIKTNIARNARMDDSVAAIAGSRDEAAAEFDKLALTTPEKAAKVIVKAVERNKRRATIGPDGRAIDVLSRLPAPIVQRAIARAASRRRP